MLLKKIKIGNFELNSNIFIAPLAGFTNLASRLIYREQKAGIAYSEMVSALGLCYNYNKSVKLLNSNKLDKPLGIQLFGPDALSILNAFLKLKDMDFDLIDINCGCSVKKVLKAESGACLLKKPEEIYKIVLLLKQNTDKPVSIKIRSGWDEADINFLEILEAGIKGGIDLVTFHPRTRSMMFKGSADWSLIKIMKEKSSVPVIGNGDIFTGDDAKKMIELTGCDGVMIARGLIENPFLIEEIYFTLQGLEYNKPDITRRIDQLIKHSELIVKFYGERAGIMLFRKYLKGYLKGIKNISVLRDRLNSIEDFKNFKISIEEFFKYY